MCACCSSHAPAPVLPSPGPPWRRLVFRPRRRGPSDRSCLAAASRHRISRSCSLAVEFGPSSLRTIMASADFSFGVDGRCRPSARIAPRPKEISQGKALILRSVAVGFTCARVRLAFGHPRPLPGYPTAAAFYPVPVRQLRALLPASSPPRLATPQLPSAICSGQSARGGLPPPRSTPCLAHNEKAGSKDTAFFWGFWIPDRSYAVAMSLPSGMTPLPRRHQGIRMSNSCEP